MKGWKPIEDAPMDEVIDGGMEVAGEWITAPITWMPDFTGGEFAECGSLRTGWTHWRPRGPVRADQPVDQADDEQAPQGYTPVPA